MVINYVDRGFFIQFSKNVNNRVLLPSFGGSSCDPLWYHSKTNPNRLLAFSARFWRFCLTMFVGLLVLSCSVFSRQWGIVRAFKIASSVDVKDIEHYEVQDSFFQDDDIVLTADKFKIQGLPEIPLELKNSSVYSASDFRNGDGRYAPYWSYHKKGVAQESSQSLVSASSQVWGPCYPPAAGTTIDWADILQKPAAERFPVSHSSSNDEDEFPQPKECYYHTDTKVDGMCRPGFLIIGAGKCGTSSLYHYLVEHPRVLPARQKQVGFFKYFLNEGMKCYLSYFPSTQEFLSSGALITGEAFPGYLPYPEVAPNVKRLLGPTGPKIVVSVREPLSRAYSSYRYNYLRPALKALKKGKGPKHVFVPKDQPDEYYIQNFLFSFEELISAELKNLKSCLVPGGEGEQRSKLKYPWAEDEYMYRDAFGLPQLVDVELCHFSRLSNKLPLPSMQFSELSAANPSKVIDIPRGNHLIQSMIGRGLYALAMEWWYLSFSAEDIHVVCLEGLSKDTEEMDKLTSFLGLPKYDWSEVLSRGRYNMGGNEGYDTLTKIDNRQSPIPVEIPISKALREEVQDFISVYNERLFKLIGHRCPW